MWGWIFKGWGWVSYPHSSCSSTAGSVVLLTLTLKLIGEHVCLLLSEKVGLLGDRPTSGASLYTTIPNIMCLSHDSGTHIHTTHGSSRTVLGTQVGVMIAIKTNRVLSKQVQHF